MVDRQHAGRDRKGGKGEAASARRGKPPERADRGPLKGVLTMREACRLLNVHSNTLRRWSDQGLITTYRIGLAGHRRFKIEDVNALLMEQKGRTKRSRRGVHI